MVLQDTFSVALAEQLITLVAGVSLWWFVSKTSSDNEVVSDALENGWKMLPKTSCGVIGYETVLFWSMVELCAFWLISLVFTLFDAYNQRTRQLARRRIYNPGRKRMTKISWNMVRIANYRALSNTLLSYLVHMCVFMPLYERRGNCDAMWFETMQTRRDWAILFIKLSLLTFVTDFIFYVGHRVLHESKYLYQNVHKYHHQWVDTFAVTAIAAHPFEHVASNLTTVFGAPLVLGLPFGLTSLFVTVAIIHTCVQHSGYGVVLSINPNYVKSLFCSKSTFAQTNSDSYNVGTGSESKEEEEEDDDENDAYTRSNADIALNAEDKVKRDTVAKCLFLYDFHHDFHHHFQTAEYGIGKYCDRFFKTRLKDVYPKAWEKVVEDCFDAGYLCTGVTKQELEELVQERQRDKRRMDELAAIIADIEAKDDHDEKEQKEQTDQNDEKSEKNETWGQSGAKKRKRKRKGK